MTESKVEIHGFTARNYDLIMNIGSLGKYGRFIKDAIARMDIQPEDAILDLGCGTGRNSCLMASYLNEKGRIVGIDIGQEMIEQFEKNCAHLPNVTIINQRIEQPLPFTEEFDKVFMSFVFHGFVPEHRQKIIENARKALKDDGELVILDFNEFDLNSKPFWFRIGFKKVECPLAFEYIEIDWKSRLREWGFDHFDEHLYFMDTIRLLKAKKVGA